MSTPQGFESAIFVQSAGSTLAAHTQQLETLMHTEAFPALMDRHFMQRTTSLNMGHLEPVALRTDLIPSALYDTHGLKSRFLISDFHGELNTLPEDEEQVEAEDWIFRATYKVTDDNYVLVATSKGTTIATTNESGGELRYKYQDGASQFLAAIALGMGANEDAMTVPAESFLHDLADSAQSVDRLLEILGHLRGEYQSTTTAHLPNPQEEREQSLLLRHVIHENPSRSGMRLDTYLDWGIGEGWVTVAGLHQREATGDLTLLGGEVKQSVRFASQSDKNQTENGQTEDAFMRLLTNPNAVDKRSHLFDPEKDLANYMRICTTIMAALRPALQQLPVYDSKLWDD